MQEQLNVYLKCFRDKYNRALKYDESIAVRLIYYNFNFISIFFSLLVNDWYSLRYTRRYSWVVQ